jgi:hypothetical protein
MKRIVSLFVMLAIIFKIASTSAADVELCGRCRLISPNGCEPVICPVTDDFIMRQVKMFRGSLLDSYKRGDLTENIFPIITRCFDIPMRPEPSDWYSYGYPLYEIGYVYVVNGRGAYLITERTRDSLVITDALAILKHLSKIEPLCYGRVLLYDFYDTGNITIYNALEILKYLAKLDNVIE